WSGPGASRIPAARRFHAEGPGRRGDWRRPCRIAEGVVAQVTLSLLLLIGAGLFVKSLNNLRNLGPGFPVERLIGFNLDPSLNGYKPDRAKLFYQRLTESVSALPGVQSVGLATVRILEGNEWDSSVTVEGYTPPRAGDHPEPYMNQISPNYFATLNVPFVAGR